MAVAGMFLLQSVVLFGSQWCVSAQIPGHSMPTYVQGYACDIGQPHCSSMPQYPYGYGYPQQLPQVHYVDPYAYGQPHLPTLVQYVDPALNAYAQQQYDCHQQPLQQQPWQQLQSDTFPRSGSAGPARGQPVHSASALPIPAPTPPPAHTLPPRPVKASKQIQQKKAAPSAVGTVFLGNSFGGLGSLFRGFAHVATPHDEDVTIVPPCSWEPFLAESPDLLQFLVQSPAVRAKVRDVQGLADGVFSARQHMSEGFDEFDARARLDHNELAAVLAYTYDDYSGQREGNLYFELNKDLRLSDQRDREVVKKTWGVHVGYALRAFQKLPNFEGFVFRGFSNKEQVLQEYHHGRTIQWGAFTSTTQNKQVARGFAGEDGVILVIDVLTGKDINSLSFVPAEDEILLSPNHRFTVTSRPYVKSGITHVNLMEIATEDEFRS